MSLLKIKAFFMIYYIQVITDLCRAVKMAYSGSDLHAACAGM